jgi:hypothetical protein
MPDEKEAGGSRSLIRLTESIRKCWRALVGLGVLAILSTAAMTFGFVNDFMNMFISPPATVVDLRDLRKLTEKYNKELADQLREIAQSLARNQDDIKRDLMYLHRDLDYCKSSPGLCTNDDLKRIEKEFEKQDKRSREIAEVLPRVLGAMRALDKDILNPRAAKDPVPAAPEVAAASDETPASIETYITEEGDAIASSDFSMMEMSLLINTDTSDDEEPLFQESPGPLSNGPPEPSPSPEEQQQRVNAWDTTTVFDVTDSRRLNLNIPAPAFDPPAAAPNAVVLITNVPSFQIVRVYRADGVGVGAGDTMTISQLQGLSISTVQTRCSIIGSIAYSVTLNAVTDHAVATLIGNSAGEPLCQTG